MLRILLTWGIEALQLKAYVHNVHKCILKQLQSTHISRGKFFFCWNHSPCSRRFLKDESFMNPAWRWWGTESTFHVFRSLAEPDKSSQQSDFIRSTTYPLLCFAYGWWLGKWLMLSTVTVCGGRIFNASWVHDLYCVVRFYSVVICQSWAFAK